MDIWWKINLTATVILFLMTPFMTPGKDIKNLADFIIGWGGLLIIISWPIYLLVSIWK
jgi:hypothetical protein